MKKLMALVHFRNYIMQLTTISHASQDKCSEKLLTK